MGAWVWVRGGLVSGGAALGYFFIHCPPPDTPHFPRTGPTASLLIPPLARPHTPLYCLQKAWCDGYTVFGEHSAANS